MSKTEPTFAIMVNGIMRRRATQEEIDLFWSRQDDPRARTMPEVFRSAFARPVTMPYGTIYLYTGPGASHTPGRFQGA